MHIYMILASNFSQTGNLEHNDTVLNNKVVHNYPLKNNTISKELSEVNVTIILF